MFHFPSKTEMILIILPYMATFMKTFSSMHSVHTVAYVKLIQAEMQQKNVEELPEKCKEFT
jgi:hypothetical protein